MTVIPIRVKITSDEAVSGKQTVIKSLQEIRSAAANTNDKLEQIGPSVEKGTKQAVTGLDILKRTLVALGGIAIIREIIGMGNAFGELRNKVLLVSSGINEANNSLDRLFDIANKNRAPVQELASLFQKVSIASKELGASQEDLFKFTDVVAKGLAIQGGSANTASGALLQLSQAMGSGIVRAEEFNSILEGAFPIALAAAKGIDKAGGSVAQLRQLIADGQITSQEFFRGLLSQSDELEKQFAKMNPTIASAGIVLKNNFIKVLGESEGIFGLLAVGILALADNLETLLNIATAVGIGLLVAFSPGILGVAIGYITTAVTALTVAIAANPIGALVVVVTAAVSALVLFSDKISLSSEGIATLSDLISVFAEDIGAAFSEIGQWFSETFAPLSGLVQSVFGDMEFSIAGILKFTANVIDRYIGLWRGAYMAVVAIFENLPNAFMDIFTRALNASIGLVETGINKISGALNNLPGVDIGNTNLGRINNDAAGGAEKLGKDVSDAFAKGFNQDTIADNLDNALARAEEKAKARLKVSGASGLPGIPANDNQLSKVKDGLKDTKTELTDFGKTFNNIMASAEDSLTNFVKTGKLDFKGLINSILEDLIRLQVKQSIIQPISNAVSSAAGSLFTKTAGSAVASTDSSFLSSIGSFFGFDQGVDYVPRDMYAKLHRGERVVTAKDNQSNGTNEYNGSTQNTGNLGNQVIVNQTFNVSTGVKDTVRAEMIAMLPEFQSRAVAAVNEANLRGQ